MTGLIMKEYLCWLNKKMRDRKILLLLDNFSGHELGVQLIGGLEGLPNVRIAWLPPNTTSHWQPLDQGIIASFKLGYRKQWINFMLRQLEADKNPNKTVNILKAMQWSRLAWEALEAHKLQKCWWKSTLIPKPENEDILQDNVAEIEELSAEIARLPGDSMLIGDFLEPAGEVIIDEDEDIFEPIVERYSTIEGDDIDEIEDEDEGEEETRPSLAEAIKALNTLQLFASLGEDGGRISVIRALEQMGKDISQEKIAKSIQCSLDSWLPK
jgi:hypothetical protein